jgi:Right handed beta helix region
MSSRWPCGVLAGLVLAGCGASSPPSQEGPAHVTPQRSKLSRALRAARPGETIALPAGTYGRPGTVLRVERGGSAGRPIVVRGPRRGAPAVVRGHVRIDASHVRFDRVVFAGPTGAVLPKSDGNPRGEEVEVWVRGADVELSSCEVRGSAWHAGVFVTGRDVRIVRCHIHHNGDAGRDGAANLDQGVYWDSGSGLLANNLIDHNVAFGVQLYKAPSGVKVLNNTVVRNGRAGVIVSADAASNVVANNIVAFNGAPAVSFDLNGRGNMLTGNLFWANGKAALASTDGLRSQSNIEADPRFVGRDDYRLRSGSPAAGRALRAYPVDGDLVGHGRPAGRPADLGAYQSP